MHRRQDRGARGQLIIVTGLLLAVVFVGLALVLNAGIYAENLSSRETGETERALSFSVDAEAAVAEAYERTNDNASATATEARDTFQTSMADWTAAQQRRAAGRGTGVETTTTPEVGWRLEQSADGAFTSNGGDGNWTLVDGADSVAAFELNVTRQELHDADGDWSGVNGSFQVAVSGSDDWRLHLFRNSSHVLAHAGVPGEHSGIADLPDDDTCAVALSRARVDLRAERLGGLDCEALNFSDDVDDEIDVAFDNATRGGEQVNGTYTVVVNGSTAANTGAFDDPDGDDPTATAVIYAATYDVHYSRSDVDHSRTGRYAVREESYAG